MGAYLSEPITEKISSEGENEVFSFGASSMQGWRVSQEDAHNAILDFDNGTSFWAVFDGHGGAEVSAYCALKLPDYLKKLDSYKTGEMEKALKEAFIGFDQTLLKETVIEELKQLAKKNPDNGADDSEADEEENLADLCQEARMPLREVLERYKEHQQQGQQHCAVARLQNEAGAAKPISPFLRAKAGPRSEAGPSSSSTSSGTSSRSTNGGASAGPSSSSSSSSSTSSNTSISIQAAAGSSSSSTSGIVADDADTTVSSSSSGKCEDTRQIVSPSTAEPVVVCNIPDSSSNTPNNTIEAKLASESVPEVSQSTAKPIAEAALITNGDVVCGSSEVVTNTSTKPIIAAEGVSSSSSAAYENGEVSSNTNNGEHASATAASSNNSISSTAERAGESKVVDSSTDDSEDDAYEEDKSSTEDGEEDPDLEELETEEEEDDMMTEEDEEFINNMIDEPGKDSGCTAVVALIREKELYVANAGDSRCVVCRKGDTIEMSLDHKPEDQIEFERIQKAGGRVTLDGRVNGGLNLSRAIGDHGYKMNRDLTPEEQMISALPDVRRITLTDEDEFMVLACDGIWNFMTSEDVVKFVRAKLTENPAIKLTKICEELFDHCLAPNTMGDGTGCDNMTAIIVRFNKKSPVDFGITSSSVPSEIVSTRKRSVSADDVLPLPDDESLQNNAKRQKTTEEAGELSSSNSATVPADATQAPIIDTSS